MRTLEVCTGSIESIKAACEGGAHRVELCSALSLDGLTPSMGMIRCATGMAGPRVHVLIRPRGGDFVYSPSEVDCMQEDILACRSLGVDGVVIGALDAAGNIDTATCRRLVEAAAGMAVTFHRAFDVCSNPLEALQQVIGLGCTRLLTSGQAATAQEGIPMLRQLVTLAAGRISIMPAGGVNPANAAAILDATGAVEIHASARTARVWGRMETDALAVSSIIANINTKIS